MDEPAQARHPASGLDAAEPVWREPVRGGHAGVHGYELSGLEQLLALRDGGAPQPPLSRLTGMRIGAVSAGVSTFTLPLTEWLTGAGGAIGPGILTIPADAAMATAIITGLPPGTQLTTSELALRQVRPAVPGRTLSARGTVIDAGPPVAIAEATVTDEDGLLIAHATSMCVRLEAVSAPGIDAVDGTDPGEPEPAGPDPWEREPLAGMVPDPALWLQREGLEVLEAQVRGAEPAGGLAQLIGLAPVEARLGQATFALPATRWLCAPPPGRAQGGTIATLVEAAMSGAIQTSTQPGSGYVPVELKLNFVRPLRTDDRVAQAHGTLVHAGRRIAVARAEAHDADGRPIAVATGSSVAAAG